MNDERSESIVQKIAYVEKAHYDLMRVSLASLEGAEIRDLGYAVLISDRVLKIPFTNHASCVNVGEDEADDLIDGVVTYLSQKRRQPHFFISPTTRPADFGERLKAKGFVRLPDDFAWMVYEERHQVDLETNQKVVIDIVDRSVVSTFNRVRTKAFDTPAPIASAFAEAYIKTLSRKAMTHHLAYLDDVAVGTTTLISAKGIGCIYNVGFWKDTGAKEWPPPLCCGRWQNQKIGEITPSSFRSEKIAKLNDCMKVWDFTGFSSRSATRSSGGNGSFEGKKNYDPKVLEKT